MQEREAHGRQKERPATFIVGGGVARVRRRRREPAGWSRGGGPATAGAVAPASSGQNWDEWCGALLEEGVEGLGVSEREGGAGGSDTGARGGEIERMERERESGASDPLLAADDPQV